MYDIVTSSDVERHEDVLSQHITSYDSVLTSLNSTLTATTHKEDLKETNFSEDIFYKRPGRLGTEVLSSQVFRSVNTFPTDILGDKSACL